MAKHLPSITIFFSLLLLFLLHHHPNLTTATTEQELDAAIAALTTNGYNLFGNAIATSDLRYQIIAGTNFTFFSPSDSDLFSLDMETDASDYVQNLRYHVAIHRLSISDLNNLPPLYFINTMIPHHCLLITNNNYQITASNGIFNGSFSVDGVPISVPDLFTGSSITIHGLHGILALKKPERMNSAFDDIDLGSLSPSFQINNCFSSFSPSKMPDFVTPASSPDSLTKLVTSPSPSPAPFSVSANSPAPVPVPVPVPESASSPDSFNSPAPFSIWATSPSPFWASSPATVSTSKEESSFKKREKQHERSHRRKKIDRKKVQDRRRHIDIEEHDEEIPSDQFL